MQLGKRCKPSKQAAHKQTNEEKYKHNLDRISFGDVRDICLDNFHLREENSDY
jgi:hypothetical protein